MPLVLTLKKQTSIPLEVDSIRMETVRSQTLDEIRATPIHYGNKTPPLNEFFEVTGSAAEDSEMIWNGDCSKVKLIGTGLRSGRVIVHGNVGMHCGAEMRGGELIVHGNAADWLGAEMHGGRIHIHGDAGHLVGAVYRGGRKGMTGGEILIDGNAGNEIGNTMRRGLIAIRGQAGDAVGFNLIAGTILIFGAAGIRPGAGMRRGTIGLLGPERAPQMLPTFRAAGRFHPVFLQIYLRHLKQLGFAVPEECFSMVCERHCGDFLEFGKGEILVRAS
ncbi:MAG: fhcC [Planctomycetaceae bacterium]|nr:fhcC [Planctomycetaceae bacterium]